MNYPLKDAIINYLDRFGENPSFEEYRALMTGIKKSFDEYNLLLLPVLLVLNLTQIT